MKTLREREKGGGRDSLSVFWTEKGSGEEGEGVDLFLRLKPVSGTALCAVN